MTRVLIGAPVRERAWVLPTWLAGIEEQRRKSLQVDVCCFYEPGDVDDGTYDILRDFGATLLIDDRLQSARSSTDIVEHRWGDLSMYEHMASMRNRIANYAERNEYDYLFSLDTDIILQGPREVPINTPQGEHLGVVTAPYGRVPPGWKGPVPQTPVLMCDLERLLRDLPPDTVIGPQVNMDRRAYHVLWNYMMWETTTAPRDADGDPLWAERPAQDLCQNSGRWPVDVVLAALLIPVRNGRLPRWVAYPQGEDVGFPASAKKAGLSFLVDTDLVCRHVMNPRVLDPPEPATR